MTELERALTHIKTRADAWAVKVIKDALSHEPNRDIKEIADIMKCDADAETKCKMIFNILTAKPHYFEEQDSCETCRYTEGSPFCLQYCPYDKAGYCYSDNSCMYQLGDSAEFCGIHEEKEMPCDDIAQEECGAKYGKLLEQKSGKYTADELKVFADGISLSLCSKKSAQHWSYDEKTAEQIRWLECLHSKVMTDIADMNCGAKMESEE